jgi:hypothetical protein
MIQMLTGGVAALLLLAGGETPADPISGTVKKVESAKVVITIDNKDASYDVAKDVKVTRTVRSKKVTTTEDVAEGLAGVKEGADVKVTIEKKDGKDTVTKIELAAAKKKKKKKAS